MKKNKSIPRVLHVFTILGRGGAESMIMNYYRNINRNKIQFDFLVHRPERGVFEDEIESLGGKIYRLSAINPFYPNKYYKELDVFLQSHPYKIIHSHINTFSSFPLKVAKKNNVYCRIAHAHTTTLPITLKMIWTRPKDCIKILFKNSQRRKVAGEATHLMACGESAGSWLFGNNKFIVLPNAIDIRQYQYNEQESFFLKEKYGVLNNLVVGHVGNFSYAKNYFFLLSVFKKVKCIQDNSKLVLIGDGNLKYEVMKLAKELEIVDDIIFMGIRDDVNRLLQMIDVFLFPSYYEGLPVTLIEAQAAGLKIFASDKITKEVALTDDITFLSLEESAEFWAKRILDSLPYIRKSNKDCIRNAGYDVIENAKWLENFYLKQIENIV